MRTKHASLLVWLKTATDAEVSDTGTSRAYLRLIAYGHKTASAEIASRTERSTAGLVTRKDLRPNDWQQIWPELSAPNNHQAA
jgi:DNA-binding transcriptional regulator YdaS (Cro superfamily)